MDFATHLYDSGLIPAAPVSHGYKNFWIRDGYYIGICSSSEIRKKIWQGMVDILDRYKWKLEIHAKAKPKIWYELIHVRYSPDGHEIGDEHWLHNQWDSIGNLGEVCLDMERVDLVALLVDYLKVVQFHREPSAGAWEDRNSCDAYSLAACISFLQRAKSSLPERYAEIDSMVKRACARLYSLLPYATTNKTVCLSLLGVIWPFDAAGPYRQEIIDIVQSELMREPFGFIRYVGDAYDGEGFGRRAGNEVPWLLGDAFMAFIEPNNPKWMNRLNHAYDVFGCIPEAYIRDSMKVNRNSPLLWPTAMYLKKRAQNT